MVKVGDRVIVVGNEAMFGSSKEERNGVGVISDLLDREGYYGVTLDTGYYVAAKPENIHYYAETTVYTTPPQKITQNGYEYSLVGPVKPEWLVDGAWVVNVHDGGKRLVEEERPGVFNLKVNNLVSIRYHEGIRDQYRPHQASDWKWGDWAMYEGKRVFVVYDGPDRDGDICVSGKGVGSRSTNLRHVTTDKLTPTF